MFKNNISNDNYVLPVSSGQERLWFLQALDERLGAAYNISAGIKIQNIVNRVILQKAINFVVLRHEALRTAICKVDGVLQQVVDPHLLITIHYIDHATANLPDSHQQVLKEMQLEARKPFDLSSSGLIRFSLYRIQSDSFYLLMILHHSIADGASVEILIREIITCYQQILNEGKIVLSELPYQFADIIAWQNERISTDIENDQIAYWTNKLKGTNTCVRFPESIARIGEPNFKGETLPFCLNKNVFNEMVSLSKEIRVSPYSVLFSAFALLIHYYTGETDFLIGVPTVNRDHKETWPVVGYLANTVVIRVNLNLITTVKDLILQIHNTISEALSYQDLSIAKVVDALQAGRTGDLGTIFQFMFSYQESNDIQSILDSFGAEKILIDNGLSKFDIFLFILNQNNSLDGFVEYSTELFDSSVMLSLIKHFINICIVLSKNIDTTIYSSGLLNPITLDEIHQRIKVAKNDYSSRIKSDSLALGVDMTRQNTAVESELEKIWQELLGIQNPISIHENFFELGGNSLLATKLVDMINRKLNVCLPIKIIFLHPCIEKIANYIDSLKISPILQDKKLDKFVDLYESDKIEKLMEEFN